LGGQWSNSKTFNIITRCCSNNFIKNLCYCITLCIVITFHVSRRRREMYCGHPPLCMSVCLSAVVRPHYCTDPGVTWRSGRGCPLIVHYWADLQSGHGLRCYSNVTRTRNVSECMLVLALCLVDICWHFPSFRGFHQRDQVLYNIPRSLLDTRLTNSYLKPWFHVKQNNLKNFSVWF